MPYAVYPANEVFVSEHGLPSQPRRFQSCIAGHRIDFFAADRNIEIGFDIYTGPD